MVQELLKQPQKFLRFKTLLALPEFLKRMNTLPESLNILEINKEDLSRISSLTAPNQAILEIEIPHYQWKPNEIIKNFSFFLDNIQDPGNLGTIIRTADWFGIQNVFCSRGSVDLYNPKVIQATMGSFSRVRVHYEDAATFGLLPEFQNSNFLKVATVLNGENMYESEFGNCGIIFFGNESKGLNSSIIEKADKRVSILKNPEHSGAESLNISVAAAIFGSELLRRRLIRNES